MSTPQSSYIPKRVYACDGVRFEFPVEFEVDRPNDVLVFLLLEATGVPRRMVRNQDYVIREEDDGTLTVVTRVTPTRPPWPAGYSLVVMRRMPIIQPSGRSSINPRVFSNRIDSLTRIYQQLREKLDRTLHVGLAYPPFFKTSEPYPVLFADKLSMVSRAKNSQGLWRVIRDACTFTSIPSGGTLFITLKSYLLWPIEKLSVVSIPVSGLLDLALVQYTLWPNEKINVTSIPSSGLLDQALLSYNNYAIEKLSVVSVPSGGSLT